jgi:hypothetical protein
MTQKLTAAQIEYLLRAYCRLPGFYRRYSSQFSSVLFYFPHERPYQLVLAAFEEVLANNDFAIYHQPEKLADLIETHIVSRIQSGRLKLTDDEILQLFNQNQIRPGLIYWIWRLSKLEEIDEKAADGFMQTFLRERAILQPLGQRLATAPLEDLPKILQEYITKERSISQATSSPARNADPFSWSPTIRSRNSTGVDFIDTMVAGGHIPGEVYGVLGAYGSGKTMLTVQLACRSVMHHKALADSLPGYKPKYSVIFHYEADYDEMMSRVISHICEISWNEIIGYDLSRLSGRDREVKYKPYEYDLWSDLIASGSFLGEYDRLVTRMPIYKDYIFLVDMSGTVNARLGSGYVDEIAKIIDTWVMPSIDGEIGFVGIDYVGLCSRRYLNANNLHHEKLRHLIGEFGALCRQKIALPFNCPVWLMHQLSGVANKKQPMRFQHHADAAESKAFAENLVYCFELAVPHPKYQTTFLTCSKARRSAIGPPQFLWINGPFNRLEDANQKYIYDEVMEEVYPRNAFGRDSLSNRRHKESEGLRRGGRPVHDDLGSDEPDEEIAEAWEEPS